MDGLFQFSTCRVLGLQVTLKGVLGAFGSLSKQRVLVGDEEFVTMFAEIQLLASVQQPSPRVCCFHLHTSQNDHLKVRTSVLPLNFARDLKTRSFGSVTNVIEKCSRNALLSRASLDQEISGFEEVNAGEDFQLDFSVFEEVYQTLPRVVRTVGARVRGVVAPQSTLIPDDWKDVQTYLHRSKKDRKQETLALQLEWAKKRALEERQTRLELAKQRRLAAEQELVPAGASDEIVLVNEVKDLEEVGPSWTVVSGRAKPKDFRYELQLSSVEEIARSLSIGEELESTSQVEAELVKKKEFEEAQKAQEAVGNEKKQPLLTGEEMAILKSKNRNFSRVSSNKWSPLHTLAASGQVYLAVELVKRAVDVNVVDGEGLTPLHRAVQAGRKTMVRMLLKAGADAQVLDKEGATLLHYAALIGNQDISKLLIRHGVDVNIADADGWTPLHVAVQSGRLELIKALVYKGADVTIANKVGNTALDLAIDFGSCFNFYDAIKFIKKISVLELERRSATYEDEDDYEPS